MSLVLSRLQPRSRSAQTQRSKAKDRFIEYFSQQLSNSTVRPKIGHTVCHIRIRQNFRRKCLISFRKLYLKTILSQKNSTIDEKFKISLNAFEVFSIFALGEVHSFFYNADTVLQFKYCYLVNFSVILTGILVMNTKRSKAKSASPKESSSFFRLRVHRSIS